MYIYEGFSFELSGHSRRDSFLSQGFLKHVRRIQVDFYIKNILLFKNPKSVTSSCSISTTSTSRTW